MLPFGVHNSSKAFCLLPGTQEDEESTDDLPDAEPPQHVQLRRTEPFRRVPSTLRRSHTMLTPEVDGETNHDIRSGSLEIDEMSPDEDERFAASVLRGQRK